MKEIFHSEHVALQLEKLALSAMTGRLPNSILFSGTDGGASIFLVLNLIKSMVCLDERLSFKACEVCQNCIQCNSFSYPDLHISFPFAKSMSKSKDPVCDEFRSRFTQELSISPYLTTDRWVNSQEASNSQFLIPTSEARSIAKTLSLSSFSGKPRFILIWQPEKLHSSTANKLLKMIEEPGANVYFFLVTHQFSSVLKTITSRCVSIKTPKNTTSELQDCFEEIADLKTILLTADGSIGRVQDMIKKKSEHAAMASELISWLRLIYSTNITELIEWSEKMAAKTREETKIFLAFASKIIEQAVLINLNASRQIPFGNQNFNVENFAPYIKNNSQATIQLSLEICKRDIIRNANIKLCLLECSLQLSKHIGKA